MEPDPLIVRTPGGSNNKKTTTTSSLLMEYSNRNNEMLKKKNIMKTTSGLNVVVCVLCLVCITACVYNALKETILEDRLTYLENKVASLEENTVKNFDVIIERFRREAENRFKQRFTRDVANEHHLIMGLKRTQRDAPECICPAGKVYKLSSDINLCYLS